MVRPLASLRLVAMTALSGLAACTASGPPPRPPGLPPTPKTVTLKNPGGDAADPEQAALERLAAETWGTKRDRFNTLRVPLMDARHWQRVKLFGYPTRAAFRFGDSHHGVVALWYTAAKGSDDPDSCLARFVSDARPVAEGYGVRIDASRVVHLTQPRSTMGAPPPNPGPALKKMVVQVVDASVDSIFASAEYVGALAAYQSWPGTCLVQGFVIRAGKHRALAGKIRDRWVAEGAGKLVWDRRLVAAPPTEAR